MSISIFSFLFRRESPDYACLAASNRNTSVSIFMGIFSMTAILDNLIHLKCNCVPNCNKLLQIGTHLQCNCAPICNKLLQVGMHLQCNCIPIRNKLLQIGTHLQCVFVPMNFLLRLLDDILRTQ